MPDHRAASRSAGRVLWVAVIALALGAVTAPALASWIGGGPAERAASVAQAARAAPKPGKASPPKMTARQAAGRTCMPKPSACGFPDATNTGVPAGTSLSRVDGSVELTTPGEVYSGKEVHGEISVLASNVTIEKVRVISDADYPIRTFAPSGTVSPTGTVIRDVEIDLQGRDDVKGIAFDNYTAERVWFHNGLDCAHTGRNVVIKDSFCDLPKLSPGSSAHADGFQSDGGSNLQFIHNTIRNPNDQTSAILMSTNTSPISTVVIANNLMSGGGYTVYCGTDEGGVATDATYIDNVISREFFPKGGYYGATTGCDRVAVAHGNIWDGNLPGAGGAPPGSGDAGANQGLAARYPLSVKSAMRVTRLALERKLGHRFTRRAPELRVRCKRRSASAVTCKVRWRRRSRHYAGSVRVRRVARNTRRYSLRIRSFSGGHRGRLIKKSGSVRSR